MDAAAKLTEPARSACQGRAAACTGAPVQQKLTPEQQQALTRLRQAATQLEGVFLEMVMNAMQDTVPKNTLFGNESASEATWQSMLNDQRAQAMAQSGSLGIALVLEQQLRSQVLSDASREAHTEVERRIDP
jgi:Rod binding domain-containing protein